ncbi:hypothetical protein Vadar_027187 [Vaccinium darrowii]|uniref:Uncharacterized protein n=1 Tax=Vaccinium darrowii TaxID=229202 RepID=A0ACB7ZM60_9ERIC|nr:hypothetical protein Vadar_027187 [Vaccinium darrowii]
MIKKSAPWHDPTLVGSSRGKVKTIGQASLKYLELLDGLHASRTIKLASATILGLFKSKTGSLTGPVGGHDRYRQVEPVLDTYVVPVLHPDNRNFTTVIGGGVPVVQFADPILSKEHPVRADT